MSPSRRFIPLVCAVALLAVLPGCGGPPDARSLFDDALARKAPARSGVLLLALDAEGAGGLGLPPKLLVRLGGPFRARGPAPAAYDMALLVATRDGRLRARVIRFGRSSWLVIGETAYELSSGALKRLGAGRAAPLSPGTFGLDPAAWLSDPKADGTAGLDGEKLVRIRATPDVPKLLAEIDRLLGRAGSSGAGRLTGLSGLDRRARNVASSSAVLLVGEGDRRLRRVEVELVLTGGGRLKFAYGISQPGRQQVIGPPANARPFSELTTALQVIARRRAHGSSSP